MANRATRLSPSPRSGEGWGGGRPAAIVRRAALASAVLLTATTTLAAPVVSAGSGSFTTEAPASLRLPPQEVYRTARVKGPLPTNQWWTSLAWERYSGVMTAHPLSLKAGAGGLTLSYPPVRANTDGFRAAFTPDLTVGIAGLNAPDARVDGFGDWTVDALWQDGRRSLRATFGHGLPYAFFRLSGGPARLSFATEPVVFLRDGSSFALRVNGRAYAVFAPDGSSWKGSGASRTSDLAGRTFLSVAALPDERPATFALLKAHAFARPTDSRVAWRWDRAAGEVETTFTVYAENLAERDGPAVPLLALYPHQWGRSDVSVVEGAAFESPRGPMKLVAAGSFSTRIPYSGVLPTLPAPSGPDRAAISGYLADYLKNGTQYARGSGDIRMPSSYWDGKNLGRNAELLAIAEQLGEGAPAAQLLAGLKSQLEKWLEANEAPLLYYDRTWGTLIPYPTGFGADYALNDHHFHYGYYLQAAASVAERDSSWARASTYGAVTSMLIRDVAADRGDAMFPFMRTIDPYAGHGWASGDGRGDRGPNQESSSEAINFAAGLIRWADATGDGRLLETGVWLYATQVDTAWAYWLGGNHPSGYDRSTVGILFGDGGDYRTWFSGDKGAIHGINLLPITGASLYLARDRDYVVRNAGAVWSGLTAPSYWPDIHLLYLALADPERARAAWKPDQTVEFGETRAHTLYWLASLTQYGTPKQSITADAAQYAVLERDGIRTYLAFNPSAQARSVRFSDGTVLLVPPQTLSGSTAPTALTSGETK